MDAIRGKKITIPVSYDEPCSHCGGTGADSPSDLASCPYCGGRGYVTKEQRTIFGTMQSRVSCPHCGGNGKIVKKTCSVCGGKGYSRVRKDLTVNVPAGINNGQQIRLSGKGGRGINGGPNGDLYVEIIVDPHPDFRRDGNDIHLDIPLSFVDCALGCTIDVPTVYGEVSVKIPEGTQPNEVLKIRDRGVQDLRTKKPGDEFIHIKVTTPTKLSKAQRALLEEFRSQTSKGDGSYDKWKSKFKA